MSAFDALFSSSVQPFGVAALILIGLVLLEVLGMLVALSPSHLLDQLLPDVSHPEGDLAADGFLDWLYIGRVPVLVLLILFLLGFSLTGYAVQFGSQAVLGTALPVWAAAIGALVLSVFFVHTVGGAVAKWIPKEETSSVSEKTLIGRVALLNGGDARRGYAAQAVVRDQHQRAHYIMVEPQDDTAVLPMGSSVLLLAKKGSVFHADAAPYSVNAQAL